MMAGKSVVKRRRRRGEVVGGGEYKAQCVSKAGD